MTQSSSAKAVLISPRFTPAAQTDAVIAPPAIAATFEVCNRRCLVVPEGGADGALGAPAPVIDDPDCERVGHCRVGGLSFAIFCTAPAAPDTPAEPAAAVADTLTPRELQIALQVADGKSNKEIARDIRVSAWTVSAHLRRAYAKLGVRSRAALVACILKDVCRA
jgi:DNA-binding CsgD family transcriptional regulator